MFQLFSVHCASVGVDALMAVCPRLTTRTSCLQPSAKLQETCTSWITSCRTFHPARFMYSSILLGALPPKDNNYESSSNINDDQEDNIDYETARRKLEALIGASKNRSSKLSASSSHDSSMELISSIHEQVMNSRPTKLTSAARAQRMKEILLLSSLEKDNKATTELWALWFAENGPKSASDLLDIEELVNQGPLHWEKAERKLWKLIHKHGFYWAEPVNRLATLLYMQGRLEESRSLSEVVLSLKPWHFGALSGVVMVYAGMGDTVNARIWADRRLPPIQPTGGNERRKVWVRRAVADAVMTLNIKDYDSDEVDNLFSIADDDDENTGRIDDFSRLRDEFDDAWQ